MVITGLVAVHQLKAAGSNRWIQRPEQHQGFIGLRAYEVHWCIAATKSTIYYLEIVGRSSHIAR